MDNLFEWRENWNIGVSWMDEAHQQLAYGLAGLFRQYMTGGEGAENSRIGDYCDTLYEQARVHFKDEEEWMEFLSYPQLESHLREHTMLLAELRYYLKGIRSEGNGISLEVLLALKGWLVSHVTESDQDFVEFLRERDLLDGAVKDDRRPSPQPIPIARSA